MKYGIIKVKRAFLYEENGVDVVDEVFFGWSVMWEDEGEWIEVWTHYGYRGWMERNLSEEKSREWMEEREKAGNTYVVTRGFADVMRGARVQSRMLETLGHGPDAGRAVLLRSGLRPSEPADPLAGHGHHSAPAAAHRHRPGDCGHRPCARARGR